MGRTKESYDRKPVLEVDEWTIYEFDEYNWALQKQGDEPLYYPDFDYCVRVLFNKLLDKKAVKNAPLRTLDDWLRIVEDTRSSIGKELEKCKLNGLNVPNH